MIASNSRVAVASARADHALAARIAAKLDARVAVVEEGVPEGDALVLLVGPRLLASEWTWGAGLAGWLDRHRAGHAHVVPVRIRECADAGAPFARIARVDGREIDADSTVSAIKSALDTSPTEGPGDATAEPVPTYGDDAHRSLGERLRALIDVRASDPSAEIDEQIRTVQGRLRQGPWLRAGEILGGGRFRLLAPLPGGPERGFRAYDLDKRAEVTVRVLLAPWVSDSARVQKFIDGTRKIQELDEPGLVRIHAVDRTTDGFVFVASEAGLSTFHDAVLGKKLRGMAVVQAVLDVARALGAAHQRGFVHGQLNPSVVAVASDGSARVGEFPIVRDSEPKASLFDAPESLERGFLPGVTTDVYALGMVALEGLYGAELPFWVLRGADRLVDGLDAPGSVKDALRKATAWDLSERTPDMGALVASLTMDIAVRRDLASQALGLGRDAVAADHLESIVAEEPADSATLHRTLGEAYRRLGRDAEATGHLLAALRTGSELLGILPLLREAAAKTGDWRGLVTALHVEADRRPEGDRAPVRIAAAELTEAHIPEPEAAISAWSRVVDEHRDPAEAARALRALGEIAKGAKDWERYIGWSRDLLPYVAETERPAIQHAIGETYLLKLEDEVNGLTWIDRAAAGGYSSLAIAKTLEEIRARRGEWPQAVALMRAQAREQSGTQAIRTLLRAAHIARAVDLVDEAVAIWREVLDHNPGHHVAVRALARNAYRAGRHAEALGLFEPLCDGFAQKACEDVVEASERASDDVSCARLLIGLGRLDDAETRLADALRLVPSHIPALEIAAPVAAACGEVDRARERVSRLVATLRAEDRSSRLVAAYVGEGDTEFAGGRLVEASAAYQRAIDLDPNVGAAWWGLAKVALQARAQKSADRAPWLRAAPGRFTAEEALARLLGGILDPEAMIAWLGRDPLGAATVAAGKHPTRLAAAIVDALLRHGLVGADLFDRLAAAAPSWARAVEVTRKLWLGASEHDDPFPIAHSYRWLHRHLPEDFDPRRARGLMPAGALRARGIVAGDLASDEAWVTLLTGAGAKAPEAAAIPPDGSAAEAQQASSVVALCVGAEVRWVLPREVESADIGSAEGVDLRVEGADPRHARIFRAGANVYVAAVRDSFVYVNHSRITTRRLMGDETVRIGEDRFTVRLVARVEDLLDDAGPAPEVVAARPARPTPARALPESRLVARTDSADEIALPSGGFDPDEGDEVTTTASGRPVVTAAPPSAGPHAVRIRDAEGASTLVAAPPVSLAARTAAAAAAPATIAPPPTPTLAPDFELETPKADVTVAEPAVVEEPPIHADPPVRPSISMPIFGEPKPVEAKAINEAPTLVPRAAPVADLDDMPTEPAPTTITMADLPQKPEDTSATEELEQVPLPPPPPLTVIPNLAPNPRRMALPSISDAPVPAGILGNVDPAPASIEVEPVETVEQPRPLAVGAPSGVLRGLSGPGKEVSVKFADLLVIGRGRACDVRIANDNKVSSQHCKIERRAEGFFLVDTQSSNGTVVNGTRVSEVRLHGGETILIGRSVLTFRVEDATGA